MLVYQRVSWLLEGGVHLQRNLSGAWLVPGWMRVKTWGALTIKQSKNWI